MNESSQGAPKPQLIEIDPEHAGQRIDNFLFTRLKGVPKSHVYRILRTGEVRINGGRCQAPRKLQLGDVVRLPPVRTAQGTEGGAVSGVLGTRLEQAILYEDEDFLVIDKPAGVAVHGGSGVQYGVIESIRALRPQAKFLELVHRLDRDTSGCLLIAKKRSVLKALHALFRDDHGVRKVYQALLAGVLGRKQLLVDAPLRKNVLQSGERIVKVARDGKPALTDFRRMRKFAHATLVEARLYTGRTHQIRVHALSMGHPVAGDERYGNEAVNRSFRQSGLKRLFLHASELSFIHPGSGKAFSVVAPLAPELQEYLDTLAP